MQKKYICLYLHVHQPFRLKNYTIFDIGKGQDYFSLENKAIFDKVSTKSYLPANSLFLNALKNNKDFKLNLSITGTIIEQMLKWNPAVLNSFKDLTSTKKVEIISETYYHSLASIYSLSEFKKQVYEHKKLVKNIFKQVPTYFRNTELIYSDYLAQVVEDMGYKGILAEGTEKILHWRSPNYLYKTNTKKGINLLLKNYKLSDDIAFRFSNKHWNEHPLTVEKYLHWIDNTPGELLNLFMDYETFGEHQWEDTGIFAFLEHFIKKATERGYKFLKVSEVKKHLDTQDVVSSPFIISWADTERDISAWVDNALQKDSLQKLYSLEESVLNSKNEYIIKLWRTLQTSDHFYYMCTKWFNDGSVHKYFSPYESPYEAFNNFNNVLIDLKANLLRR